MGKKRGSHFSKKNSTTFSLVHSSTDDGSDPQRIWVDKSKGVGIGRPDPDRVESQQHEAMLQGRRPPGHPLSFLDAETASYSLSEDQRREIIGLGLPDDGYDYLKHLRALDRAAATSQDEETPVYGLYLPVAKPQAPEEDVQMFNSRNFSLPQRAQDEEQVASSRGTVTAFSRPVQRLWGNNEVDYNKLHQAENLAEQFDDAVTDDGSWDEFLEEATKAEESTPAQLESLPELAPAEEHAPSAGPSAWDSDEESEASDLSEATQETGLSTGSAAKRRVGSIASTYWRPERNDRTDQLSMIDERFENLALQYDSDEIGELEEDDERIQNEDLFPAHDRLLQQLMARHREDDPAENSLPYEAAADVRNQEGEEGAEAAAAIFKAQEALRAAEQEEPGLAQEQHPWEEEGPKERWDCESVLSKLSSLDNHPGQIREGHRKVPSRPRIELSAKTGLPKGVLGRERGDSSAAASYQEPVGGRAAGQAAVQPRRRDENPEERKQRKTAVKEAKREARVAKKEVKEMFKQEAKRQHALPTVSVTQLSLH